MKTILIIGGRPDTRATLKRILEGRAELVEASEEALCSSRYVEGAAIDCVLLGHARPGSDALEVLTKLRADREALPFPVVIFGKDPERTDDLGRAALRAGAMEFVDEAWMSPEALLCAVDNAVNRFAVTDGEKAAQRIEPFGTHVLDRIFAFVGLLGLDGTLLDANKAPLDAAGICIEDVRGQKFWDCVWFDQGEAREAMRDACLRATRGETVRYDATIRVARGARATLDVQVAPLRDERGRVTHIIPSAVDITSRIRIEAALRESEARFRALADHMSQLAWICDDKGGAIWHNQRWYDYTGTTLEEMRGRGWERVHHPDHIERVKAKLARHLETGEEWEDTFPLRGKDGTHRWFLSRAIPIRDERGKVVQWFGTNTDITAQREAEEALRDADRRKDEFLAMLAHELRNPLAPLRTAIHIMRRLSPNEPGFERARDVIDRQVTHMARLIDDLLDVSRIARGKLELRKEPCDFARIVRQTTEDYRASLESAGLSLMVSIPRENVWVKGDPTRLAQMVGNLLHNASKFTDPGGRVEVSVEVTGDGKNASLMVKDTGVGMDAALLSRLFDPFSQAEQGIDRSKGGLGLGLALTKGLAELHDGTVTAHSEGLGRGSTFVLRLPLDASAPRVAELASASAPADPLRVMIIEDNADMAETLSQLLSLSGYRVEIAHDGRAGIAAALSTRPDVVISDIGLPGGTDGYAVAKALRADARMRSAFLIALSGYAQAEDRRRSQAAGFDAHLVKPPDLEKLASMLSRVGAEVRERR